MRCISIADELMRTPFLLLEVKLGQQGFLIVSFNSEVTIILRDVLQWLLPVKIKFKTNGLLFRLCDWTFAFTPVIQLCHLIELSFLVTFKDDPPDLFPDVNLL